MLSTTFVSGFVLALSALGVSARRHDHLVCCEYYSGGWHYNAELTHTVCLNNYPTDGEFRNQQCYGVHTELDGDDFWNACKDIGSTTWVDTKGNVHSPLNRNSLGSGTRTSC